MTVIDYWEYSSDYLYHLTSALKTYFSEKGEDLLSEYFKQKLTTQDPLVLEVVVFALKSIHEMSSMNILKLVLD